MLTIPPLAWAQAAAYQQLDVLEDVCRPQDREYVAPLQAIRELCEAAWGYWNVAMTVAAERQDGDEPAPPDVPNLTWTECALVETLYRAQQH